jgi:hypothetical protein
MEIKNHYFEFRSKYWQEGERIFYQGELTRKAIRITPEECASYQKFCVQRKRASIGVYCLGRKATENLNRDLTPSGGSKTVGFSNQTCRRN